MNTGCWKHLKKEIRACASSRRWCGIIHYHISSIKPRLLFFHMHAMLPDCFSVFLRLNSLECWWTRANGGVIIESRSIDARYKSGCGTHLKNAHCFKNTDISHITCFPSRVPQVCLWKAPPRPDLVSYGTPTSEKVAQTRT